MTPRGLALLLGLLALLGAGIALRMHVGGDLASLSDTARSQILALRWSRVAQASVVGAALAVGGVLLQSLLRNPLASPDLLGPASGASLAVVLTAYLAAASGAGAPDGLAWQAGPALVGAVGALAVVYALARRRGVVDPAGLVLIGVIVSIVCGAGVVLLEHLLIARGLTTRTTGLLMGTIRDETPLRHILLIGLATLACSGVALGLGRAMDAASFGEDEARSVGVPVGALRVWLFVLSGVLTAGAVVLAGPIGFVGLICPHLVRLGLGAGSLSPGASRWSLHGVLVLGSALAGAALLLLADAAVRELDLGSGRLPIGVLTAVVGGPIFVALLRGGR